MNSKISAELNAILKRANERDIIRICLVVSEDIAALSRSYLVDALSPLIRNFENGCLERLIGARQLSCSCTRNGVLGIAMLDFVTRVTRPSNMETTVW